MVVVVVFDGENWDKMYRLIIGSRRHITGLTARDYINTAKYRASEAKYRASIQKYKANQCWEV